MDLAELLPKVPQNPVGTLVLPLWEPVQSAPAKTVTVADIAREAEARRAVVMKTTLNCIIVRLCSLKLLNDRKKVEWVEGYTIGWWTGGLNANLIKCRKRSWREKVQKDRYLYVFYRILHLECWPFPWTEWFPRENEILNLSSPVRVVDVLSDRDSCALCMAIAYAANWTLHPSTHPNLPLCNCSAKHGTIQAHRLGELPSIVEPHVYGHKCRFDEAFLVISIVGCSKWNLVVRSPICLQFSIALDIEFLTIFSQISMFSVELTIIACSPSSIARDSRSPLTLRDIHTQLTAIVVSCSQDCLGNETVFVSLRTKPPALWFDQQHFLSSSNISLIEY